MSTPTIALQIYSIREHLTTREDFIASMKKLAEIGYTAIEIAGVRAELSDEEIKAICDDVGLKIVSAHIGMDAFDADFEGTVKKLKTWGAHMVAMPVPPAWVREEGDYAKYAKLSDELGAKLAKEGITLSYHNHSFEFQKYDGKLGIETLYDVASPENLKTQLDLCWVQRGGGCPVTFIKTYAGRMPTIHFKDFMIVKNELWLAPVGEGNLDWDRIIPAALDAGVEVVIVEQDDTHGDAFGAVASSFNFLRSKGMK
ncbi:MAG: sugar phosphate isomerase/epimerase [Anaerolineae bacterium]|jgi:sugar phosphate isomerase/epimerase|nr:sugar phosphate isomerase/epimerase [Anaerolineae bacterium]